MLTLTVHLVSANLAGDMNCDGVVNTADIGAFVLALTSEPSYVTSYPTCRWLNADLNGDGLVNGADVQGFVNSLLGSPVSVAGPSYN